jgi:hypothetical protein
MNYELFIHPAMGFNDDCAIFRFETLAELKAAANTAADLLLFIADELKAMPAYGNMTMAYELVDGDWEEIEDWRE